MRNFIQLLNFEFNRVFRLFLFIIAAISLIQTAIVGLLAVLYLLEVKTQLNIGVSPSDILMNVGKFNLLYYTNAFWYAAPFIIGLVLVGFYAILIWYRDWLGKNTFIYRLLMLPTTRLNIFFAKLVTIKIALLSIVAVQYLLLLFQSNLVKWIIPTIYREDMKVGIIVRSIEYLWMFLPDTIIKFLIVYSFILLAIALMFLIILLERSFRFIGVVLGGACVFLVIFLFSLPELMQALLFEGQYFYPGELFIIQSIIYLLVMGALIWFVHFLLKNKVTV